jgi:Protocatechuate 3,4-dioxygenase beta subunit N terminal
MTPDRELIPRDQGAHPPVHVPIYETSVSRSPVVRLDAEDRVLVQVVSAGCCANRIGRGATAE